jgi:diaminohydroxyphosphoribosylaminopyrimidine deaminase/5-amino-6-(5-phosphoribosylamino)uracil reductase
MRRAIELARLAWGATHPNPMVGALIVEDGTVVAEGWHAKDGGPHAERVALAQLGRAPKPGASMYVTLEPCCTHGRTGACTDAIKASGIKRVVIGATDPNPSHAGHGHEVLREAGIEVVPDVLAEDCADLNLIFNHWITAKSPLFALKLASTLDGRLACRSGESKWITNEQSRADVMAWRRLFPAIAVGSGTVVKDNPRLTARVPGEAEWCPLRFVFDGRLRTVDERSMPALYTDEFRARTVVVTTNHSGEGYVRKLRALGVQVWVLPSLTTRVPLDQFRQRCVQEGINGVFFEGGTVLTSAFLHQKQFDYLFMYRAPLILADEKSKPTFSGLRTEHLAQGIRLQGLRLHSFGDDVLQRGRIVYPDSLHVDEARFSMS